MAVNELREEVAAVQHEIWSHWMKYMLSVGEYKDDETWVMPKEKLKRWKRQMNTSYADLTDGGRESDRHQADKVLLKLARENPSMPLGLG